MKKLIQRDVKNWRASAFGIAVLLIIVAGCDSMTSPNASTDIQSDIIQQNSQSNSTGNLNPDFSDLSSLPKLIEGHYIVVLSGEPGKKNPRAAAALEALAKDVGNMQNARLKRVYKSSFTGFAAELTEGQVEKLRKDPRVESIEQDSYVYPTNDVTMQEYPTWGLDRIDQRELLLDRAYAYSETGAGVNVYIIDSGIRYSHAEFGGRATLGYDFVLEEEAANTDPEQGPGDDCGGHGTHVAGTVGGSTYGVAKGVNLISVRVFGCSGGSPRSRVLAAVDWVAANAELPAVANMSLGGAANLESDLYRLAIQNANAAGINYVTSAGNSNDDACNYEPARIPEVLTVGASDIGNAMASFSNYGDCLDLYAPGVSITSASINDDWSGDGTYTRSYSGTSMAAPHVSGMVALYLEVNPTASPTDIHSAIVTNATPNAVTAVPSGTNNLANSLWQDLNITPPPPQEIYLTSNGYKEKGSHVIDLSWNSPPKGHYLKIYRNESVTVQNFLGMGSFRDRTGFKGNDATYLHQLCELFYTPNCSNIATTIFGDGGGSDDSSNSPPTADFTYLADGLNVQFTDASMDSDGTISGWFWDFGDGNSSNGQDPLHSFNVGGTYTVSLTVTDDAGDTASAAKSISVSGDVVPPGDLLLYANGYKQRGRIVIDLSWSGATSATVDIYRDGALIAPDITDTGEYSDNTNQNGGGTFTHKVCEAGTQTCSNETSTTL